MTVGFIGAGNMGYAIMKGISGMGMEIYAFDPDAEKLERLTELGVTACVSGAEVLQRAKYVFLAVKPQMFDTVLAEIKDAQQNHSAGKGCACDAEHSFAAWCRGIGTCKGRADDRGGICRCQDNFRCLRRNSRVAGG